ncbi:uncharacterized protein LOC135367028 [Ornithodoros turicata]|uniref:uncharacterized protein LOC135367028 n=1 Tax=Ornithodoros turicata TaxID=34597 RepID=UPI0031394A3D
MRASGEHAVDQKERCTTPRPLSARDDIGTQDGLDINCEHIEPPILTTKIKPIGEVGDFQHNAAYKGGPLPDAASLQASLVLCEEVFPGGLPVALPALEVVLPPPAGTATNLEASLTESVPDDAKTENHELDFVEHLKEVTRPGSPYIQGLKNGTADISNRLVHPERGRPNESKRILKDFAWEQTDGLSTIPEVSEGDSRNSRETSKLSMVDKSSSTASLCASLGVSKSELRDLDALAMQELRRVRDRSTDKVAHLDDSTQTIALQTGTGWRKVLAVVLNVSLFMAGIYSHYAFGHYLKDIYEIGFEQ